MVKHLVERTRAYTVAPQEEGATVLFQGKPVARRDTAEAAQLLADTNNTLAVLQHAIYIADRRGISLATLRQELLLG